MAPHFSISCLLFSLLISIPAALPLSFNISPIRRSDANRFNFTGDAYLTDEGIQVTTNERDQGPIDRIGRATYAETLHLWSNQSQKLADFTTHFSFVIDSSGSDNFGDGLAFFLAPQGSSIKQWMYGGGLGVGSANTSAADPFVAVEFDTFPNPGIDPPYNGGRVVPHVGIDLGNITSVATATWHNNISAGWETDAYISYDSATKSLRVDFTGRSSNITRRDSLVHEVDLRDYLPEFVIFGFSAATGDFFEKHNVKSWNFSSTDVSSTSTQPPSVEPPEPSNQNPSPKRHKNNKKLIIGLVAGISSALIIVLVSVYALCFLLPKKNKKEVGEEEEEEEVQLSDSAMDEEFEKGNRPIKFTYNDLVLATNDFAEEGKLGEGGFGSVYKGYLRSTNTYIAVKKVSEGSKQGRKEYAAEVKIISQLRHINLVELLGWCHQRSELLLVYEFMPNGSLDSHLFKLNSVLTWEIRYKIAQGLASALQYLHEDLRQYVVHRDIKSSNIMLDNSFNAKLGDFGLARLVDHDKDLQTIPAGTIGYMAPEYPITGKASKETDIYSFGIVLLEIACGRRPIDQRSCKNQVVLVEWLWNLYGYGQLLDGADPKLDSSEYDARKIERLMVVGLWCAHPDSSLRPSMRLVKQVLNCEAPLPTLPPPLLKAVYNNHTPRTATATSSSSILSGGGFSSDLSLTTSSAGSASDLLPKYSL